MKDDENDCIHEGRFVLNVLTVFVLIAMVPLLSYAYNLPDIVAGYLLGLIGGLLWTPIAYARGRKRGTPIP